VDRSTQSTCPLCPFRAATTSITLLYLLVLTLSIVLHVRVFVYADLRGRTGPQAGSAATPLCWHQVQVRSLLTLQVRPLPVDDRSECWSASRKISCAQGPCQLQCRFQLLITYVAVIWVSIAYLYSLRVLNCMTSTEDTSL
jgi:hypothetical protein